MCTATVRTARAATLTDPAPPSGFWPGRRGRTGERFRDGTSQVFQVAFNASALPASPGGRLPIRASDACWWREFLPGRVHHTSISAPAPLQASNRKNPSRQIRSRVVRRARGLRSSLVLCTSSQSKGM
eukprot:7916957-Pyramimonas_sp.AAC.2